MVCESAEPDGWRVGGGAVVEEGAVGSGAGQHMVTSSFGDFLERRGQ